jgi:hypothetical protein
MTALHHLLSVFHVSNVLCQITLIAKGRLSTSGPEGDQVEIHITLPFGGMDVNL